MKKIFIILLIAHCTLQIVKAQWVQQPLPVNKPITGIKFVNSQTGWACTSQGSDTSFIISTTNSGTNWNIQVSAYNIYFSDIDFVNSQIGFAASSDNNIGLGRLYKTSNGGLNWTSIVMIPNMYLYDIQAFNKDSLWECGGLLGPDVRTTTDGGNTWQVRTTGLSQASYKIFFLNYNTGFCGSDFFLHKTTNAGMSWSLLSDLGGNSIKSIFFLNESTGWLGLTPEGSSKVAYTTNGGQNWSMQYLQPYNFNVTDIYFVNENTGYAGIGILKVYKTTNKGFNWGYQDITTGAYKLSIIDSVNGWAGNNGICKTINGGGNITYSGLEQISNEIPLNFKLHQNYPNPFNPTTNIKYQITNNRSYIKLIVYDITGREIIKLVDREQNAGTYKVDFDGSKYSSGVYFYQLTVNGAVIDTKKMILIK